MQLFKGNEQMFGAAQFGRGARERALGIDQIGWTKCRAALLAIVAVLIGRFAYGTGSLDEPVGQKCFRLGIVELGDFTFVNEIGFS